MDGLALREQIWMDLAGGLGRWEPLGGSALGRIRRRGVGDGHLALTGLGGRGQRNHQSAAEMVLALMSKRRSTITEARSADVEMIKVITKSFGT